MTTQKDIVAPTLAQAAGMLADKEISSSELTEAMLGRIRTSQNNAYITVNELAAQAAAEADRRRQAGKPLSLMDGVPVALTDNFCVQGMKMTCGSRMLENFIPPYTGTVPERLAEAGAILLGKLNMDEFAVGNASDTSIFGAVRNPHNPGHIAGGACGGAAAAIAESTAYAALGSDTGGSVRQPASLCGVVGLKPTYGRISRYGLAAFASSMDQSGILAKTAEDCAIILQLIAGQDPRDATSIPDQPGDYRANMIGAAGLKGMRIGIPQEYMGDTIREDIRYSIQSLAKNLEEAGANVEACSLPHSEYALSVFYILSSAEFNSNMNRYDGVEFGYRAAHYTNYEDMLMRTREEAFGDEVKRRILFGLYALGSGQFDEYYLKAAKARTLVAGDYIQAFMKYDLLLSPASPVTAWSLEKAFTDPYEKYALDYCTVAAGLAGLPAICIPWGEDGEELPIGAQLTGPALSEGFILQAAHGVEELRRS
ncbi:MAG: Asp-tRNA(Asn)/Glu-tRNA(Gln) amidotransferase subunit GatA [Clostridiales bacterium]|nr:Asp-tRNA(Asn)/Glu-tRNA(Gln) amidotransferase subunit GatA [Clostridiales bacterium]